MTPGDATAPDWTCDVLIVGAGPTGLTLANLLGRMGVQTILIERNARTVSEPRAVSIDDESMRVMQSIGLADAVAATISSGYGSRYYGPDGREFARVQPSSRDYGFDKRNAFEQPVLEAILRQGLDRFPSVRLAFERELLDFADGGDSVRARIGGPAGPQAITCRFLVGCDGARSLVRKQLGIELAGSTFRERWLIVDLAGTANRLRHTEVFCLPGRAAISLPGPNGIRRYEFMIGEGQDEAEVATEANVRRLLADYGVDGGSVIRRRQVYTFHARQAPHWMVGNVLLAGDAAHLMPPFAGQGMNSGIRDASNLAWKLHLALRGRRDILDTYQTERSAHVGSMIDLARVMGRIMAPPNALAGWATRLFFRALGLVPGARTYFLQMRYKPAPRFANGALWPDGRGKGSLVGRMLPQPVVEDIERKRSLLDNVDDRPWRAIVLSERPEMAADDMRLARWRQGGIAALGITPEWTNPAPGPVRSFRDVSGLLSGAVWSSYAEHVLLVRPDGYVCATAPIGNIADIDAKFDALTRLAP